MNRATSPTGWARNPDGSPGYTWNPLSGCLNHTPEGLCLGGLFPCYASRLANGRLKPLYLANHNVSQWDTEDPILKLQMYNDPFYPRFWEERLEDSLFITKSLRARLRPRGIFVCDMGELFGDWIPREWQAEVFLTIRNNPQHRFYLLTKQPQNLPHFSPFPDNAWVGVTATNYDMFVEACRILHPLKQQGTTTYISLEPLLSWDRKASVFITGWIQQGVSWLIIGACTGTYKDMLALDDRYNLGNFSRVLRLNNGVYTFQPKIEWVREIVETADQAGIRVFLKDNLLELVNYVSPQTDFAFNNQGDYRQELPE